MALLGSLALILAFAAAIWTTLTGFAAGQWSSARFAELSRQGFLFTFGLIVTATMALWYGFLSHDFSLGYVYGRSDVRMPLAYLAAAIWGGQEGSLMLWITVTATLGAAASWVNRGRFPELMPYYHGVLGAILGGFLFILNFVTPPFHTFGVIDVPADGTGLNPLLQTPLMVIHPPTLLSGFAAFAIPYAFGMAALLARDTGTDWLVATRRWTLFAWLLLSVGNILGGMWAYQELGWGGYWAWDPVENAALVPWFTASAFLHSVIIQEQRGLLKRWNAVLVGLTFLLTLLGTWMTRSGLIESVHTFAESEIGNFFLALLLAATALSVWLVATRWKLLASDARLDSVRSREGAFVLNNWLFVSMAFVVLWGTLFPKFKELVTGQAVSVGPTWFNQNMAPLGLALLVLMGLGTLLPWRRASFANLRKHFTIPVAVTLVAAPVTALAYWKFRAQPLGVDVFSTTVSLALIGWVLIVFNLATVAAEFVAGLRARLHHGQKDLVAATLDLFSRHRRRYGGYLVHVGILLIFLAFLGNAVKADADGTLRPGESVDLGDYVVRFDGLEMVPRPDRHETYASMTLLREGRVVGTLRPARFDFNDYSVVGAGRPDPMKVTSEIYIRSTPLEDVYVALLNFDPRDNTAAFKLVVLPFTWWFWFGGLVLIAGTLICLWPEDEDVRRTLWRRRAMRRLELGGLAALVVVPGVLFVGEMEAWAQDAPPAPISQTMANPEQERVAHEAFTLLMTTCDGCAGKTLATASPSCYSSNLDRARIRSLLADGESLDAVLNVFVAERGPKALAIPSGGGFDLLVWIVPMLVAGGAAAFAVTRLRKWSLPAPAPLTPDADEPDDEYMRQVKDELRAMDVQSSNA